MGNRCNDTFASPVERPPTVTHYGNPSWEADLFLSTSVWVDAERKRHAEIAAARKVP
jgi:hypothetical protein